MNLKHIWRAWSDFFKSNEVFNGTIFFTRRVEFEVHAVVANGVVQKGEGHHHVAVVDQVAVIEGKK